MAHIKTDSSQPHHLQHSILNQKNTVCNFFHIHIHKYSGSAKVNTESLIAPPRLLGVVKKRSVISKEIVRWLVSSAYLYIDVSFALLGGKSIMSYNTWPVGLVDLYLCQYIFLYL